MKLEDKLRREKIIPCYITMKSYISSGRGHIDWIVNAGKNTAYILAGLYFLGIEVQSDKLWIVILLTIGNLLLTFVIGYGWDKLKGFDYQHEWGNKRNPMLRNMSEKINEPKKVL